MNFVSIDYTRSQSPSCVIEARYGSSRVALDFRSVSGGFDPTQLGLPGDIAANAAHLQFPGIAPANYYGLGSAGQGTTCHAGYEAHLLEVNNTKIAGNNVIKFGAEGRLLRRCAQSSTRRLIRRVAVLREVSADPEKGLTAWKGEWPQTQRHAARCTPRAVAFVQDGSALPLLINGTQIPDRVLDQELLRLSSGLEMDAPHAGGMDPASLRSLALRNVIDRALLLEAARARRLDVTTEEVHVECGRRWGASKRSVSDPDAMEAVREDLLLSRVIADLTRHVPRPGRMEAEQYYRAHEHLYRVVEAVEAAHVFCGFTGSQEEQAARSAIEQAEGELRRGRPFQKVADRYSDCKEVGGSLGWIPRGVMVQEFEDVVFALQPGQRSEIFRTVFGFHIAVVTRRRKEGLIPFNEVRLEIAKDLLAESRHKTLQHALARMKAQSDLHYSEEL